MKMKRLVWGFFTIAAVALLAGCGGGGGTSLMVGGERATQAAIDALQAEADAAGGALMALQTALGADSTSEADLTTAVTTLEDMRDAYKKMAADAQTVVDAALGDDATGDLVKDVGTLASAYQQAADDREEAREEAMMADRMAREAQLRLAIADNRVGTAVKNTPDAPSGVTAVTATRDAAGMVNIDVNGTATDAYTGGSVSASSSAWTPATLTKTNAVAQSQDTVMIYTDIEAPADMLLTTKYGDDLDDVLGDVDRGKLAMSDLFPTGKSNSLSYGGDSGNAATLLGTFDGVPGVFSCEASAGCTLSTDADGELEASTEDDWRFIANMPNSATVKDPDTAYAYFGWWLNKPDTLTDAHDVEVFAGGTTDHDVAVTNAMTGTATYSGPAAGMYITKDFSAGAQTDAAYGSFTANASLTADFSNDSTPGTIQGSISGFMLDDTTPASSWRVMLEEVTLTTSSDFNGTSEANFGAGFTSDNAGTWQGSFYAGGGTADPDAQPGTVAGTFDAVTDSAAVIGGFGATKQ